MFVTVVKRWLTQAIFEKEAVSWKPKFTCEVYSSSHSILSIGMLLSSSPSPFPDSTTIRCVWASLLATPGPPPRLPTDFPKHTSINLRCQLEDFLLSLGCFPTHPLLIESWFIIQGHLLLTESQFITQGSTTTFLVCSLLIRFTTLCSLSQQKAETIGIFFVFCALSAWAKHNIEHEVDAQQILNLIQLTKGKYVHWLCINIFILTSWAILTGEEGRKNNQN